MPDNSPGSNPPKPSPPPPPPPKPDLPKPYEVLKSDTDIEKLFRGEKKGTDFTG